MLTHPFQFTRNVALILRVDCFRMFQIKKRNRILALISHNLFVLEIIQISFVTEINKIGSFLLFPISDLSESTENA